MDIWVSHLLKPIELSMTFKIEDSIAREIFVRPLQGEESQMARLRSLLGALKVFEQHTLLHSLIRQLSRKALSSDSKTLPASGALMAAFCEGISNRFESLGDWLVGSSPESIKYDVYIRRAIILALSEDLGETSTDFLPNG